MKIYSIYDEAFRPYGKVLEGYDTAALTAALENETPLPEGVSYVPAEPALEKLPIMAELSDRAYGGMPVQLGWCNGHNTKLNCLEYHRDSEINFGTGPGGGDRGRRPLRYRADQGVPGPRRRDGGGLRHRPALRPL